MRNRLMALAAQVILRTFRRPTFVLLALTLGLVGCGGHKPAEEVTPASPPAQVEVKNLNALPVEVDIAGNGTTLRLGTVHPGMTAFFVIPQTVTINGSAEFVVLARNGARPFRSGPMLLSPGAVVDLLVTPRLFNSTATIRP